MESKKKYIVSLSFQEIKLPPFEEVLILGKNASHGKIGISRSFDLLFPNGFETIDVNDDRVGSILVNKTILAKLPKDKLMKILHKKVFPFVSDSELISVALKVTLNYKSIEEDE